MSLSSIDSSSYSSSSSYADMQKELFKKLDKNSDGALSTEEFSAGKPDDVTDSMSESLFSQLDSDGDGSLTESEMSEGAAPPPPPPPPEESEAASQLVSGLSDLLESVGESSDSTESTSSTDGSDSYLELLQKILEEAQKKLEESSSNTSSSDSTSTDSDSETWLDSIKDAATSYYNANADDSSSVSLDDFVAQVSLLAQNFVSTLQDDASFRSQQAQLASKFTQ